MNAKVQAFKDVKTKVGVSFSCNMSAADFIEAWNRVPESIKIDLGLQQIDDIMNTAQGVLALTQAYRSSYIAANTVYKGVQLAIEVGASGVTGLVSNQIAGYAGEIAAKQIETLQDNFTFNLSADLCGMLKQYLLK